MDVARRALGPWRWWREHGRNVLPAAAGLATGSGRRPLVLALLGGLICLGPVATSLAQDVEQLAPSEPSRAATPVVEPAARAAAPAPRALTAPVDSRAPAQAIFRRATPQAADAPRSLGPAGDDARRATTTRATLPAASPTVDWSGEAGGAVRVMAPLGSDRAGRIAARLREQGLRVDRIDTRGLVVRSDRVRFFHDADQRAAAAVASALGGAVDVQDFTHFEPAPPPTTLELWLRTVGG